MSKVRFPQIPEPTSDPRSLVECIKALTATVNMLTGVSPQGGLGSGHVPVMYLDENRPDPENVEEGDFWLSQHAQLFVCSTKSPLSLVSGFGGKYAFRPQTNSQGGGGKKAWRAVAAASPPPADPERSNFELTKTSGGMNR